MQENIKERVVRKGTRRNIAASDCFLNTSCGHRSSILAEKTLIFLLIVICNDLVTLLISSFNDVKSEYIRDKALYQ